MFKDQNSEDNESDASVQPKKVGLATHWLLVVGGVILTLIFIILITTQPSKGGPMLVLVLLLLSFLLFLDVAFLLLQITARSLNYQKLNTLKLFYSSVLIGAGGVFLIGLQTLSQLQLIDVILVGVFELLVNFYVIRRF